MRIAWGSTTYHSRWNPDRARASAASPWPVGHGLDRAADDLGDVARRVDDEGEQRREVRRRHRDAADHPVALELGRRSRRGRARAHAPTSTTTATSAPPQARTGRAAGAVGVRLAPCGRRPRPATSATTTATAARQSPPRTRWTLEPRTLTRRSVPAPTSLRPREACWHDADVEQHEQHEQRDVADELDVDAGRRAHDEVLSTAGRCRSAMPNTVASTMPVIASRSVFDEALDEGVSTGWVWRNSLSAIGNRAGWSRNVEAGGDALAALVLAAVVVGQPPPARRRPRRPPPAGTPTPGRGRPARAVADQRSSPSCRCADQAPADQRYGGAYCRPPSDHSALRPRSVMPIGARLASKISP